MGIGPPRCAGSTSRRPSSRRIDLIGMSAHVARSLTGYVDHADGEVYWRPPRSERLAEPGTFDRPFHAPDDTVTLGLEHLGQHKRDLPTQAFVFVVSDFLTPPEPPAWQQALEHRWELVPSSSRTPSGSGRSRTSARSRFHTPTRRPARVVPVYLTRTEAAGCAPSTSSGTRISRTFSAPSASSPSVSAHITPAMSSAPSCAGRTSASWREARSCEARRVLAVLVVSHSRPPGRPPRCGRHGEGDLRATSPWWPSAP